MLSAVSSSLATLEKSVSRTKIFFQALTSSLSGLAVAWLLIRAITVLLGFDDLKVKSKYLL